MHGRRNACSSPMLPRMLEVPIEPLVGHLRNPYWGACPFPNKPKEVLGPVLSLLMTHSCS